MIQSAGLHIMMDAKVKDSSVFTPVNLTMLFGQIVEALEMKPLDKIHVYEVPVDPAVLERVQATGHFEDEGGITTVQVISTSHLSLHAWPLQNFVSLDAFSCKDYDADKALRIIRDILGVSTEMTTIIRRRKPTGESLVRYFEV